MALGSSNNNCSDSSSHNNKDNKDNSSRSNKDKHRKAPVGVQMVLVQSAQTAVGLSGDKAAVMEIAPSVRTVLQFKA